MINDKNIDCPQQMANIIDYEKKSIEGKILRIYYILETHKNSNIPNISKTEQKDYFWIKEAQKLSGKLRNNFCYIKGKRRYLEFEFENFKKTKTFLSLVYLFGAFISSKNIILELINRELVFGEQYNEEKTKRIKELSERKKFLEEIHC